MIVISIVLPAMLAARTSDMMRGLFLCFAFAAILNVFFVLGNYADPRKVCDLGLSRIFRGQELSGRFAAVAFLLSLHEVLYPGLRRVFGIIVVVIAISLLFLSNSKTSLGLAFLFHSWLDLR